MTIADKIKVIASAPINFIVSKKHKKPYVMSDVETLDYIKDNVCSVARFGDGELDLMVDIGIKFQKADRRLKERLIEVARSNNDNVLICIPDIFRSKKQLMQKYTKPAAKWWHRHLTLMRGNWYKYFDKGGMYGDTQISRFYIDVCDKDRTAAFVQKLKDLWDNRDIVFVEGKNSKLGVGNDLFANAKSIRRIICPSEHAFDRYDEILGKTLELTSDADLIICALGPTATVLSYDLTIKGRRCLDLGHIDIEYEWYLMGADKKVGIAGKEVYEAQNTVEQSSNDVIDGVTYAFD